jgi:hypothetical protein
LLSLLGFSQRLMTNSVASPLPLVPLKVGAQFLHHQLRTEVRSMDDLFCADGDEEACSAKPQTRLFTLAFTCDTVDTAESDRCVENEKETDCRQV